MPKQVHTYAFGDIFFKLDGLRLERHGAALPITRQSAEVLKYLVDNRDRVVTRTELIETFWSSAPIGADDRLNTCIRRIRNIIDEADVAQSTIKTRPRIGYQFVAKVITNPTKHAGALDYVRSLRVFPPMKLAGVAGASVMVLGGVLSYSAITSQPEADVVFSRDGYELQKFGALQSNCQFENDSQVGECSIFGEGYVRFLLNGREIMQTDIAPGAVLTSSLKEGVGAIQFRLAKPS